MAAASFVSPLAVSRRRRAAAATARTSARPARTRRRAPPSACAAGPPPPAIPAALLTLAAELAAAPPGAARYRALIALAAPLAPLPPAARTAHTLVRGCASTTHILVSRAAGAPGRVALAGASDAQVAAGLVALLVRGLDGADAAQVLALTVADVSEMTRLDLAAAPSRAVGLATMLQAVQERVRALVDEGVRDGRPVRPGLASSPPSLRYADVQAEDVAVLLSGGVDSSVAMRLVQSAGLRPHPFYLKIWLEDELAHLGDCPWEEDIACASAVCRQAGVDLELVSMQREYWDRVVSYTIAEAAAGRTPNPDVMCNSRVKFGAFYDAVGRHFPTVVTGHYARKVVCEGTGLAQLRMSPDAVKDQTYFLAHLGQEQLARAHFPLGAFEKRRVREMANEYVLPNRSRRDSQGICFLGKLKFDDFLAHHLGSRRGPLVEYETGLALGEHRGFWFYTMGQRKGIGLSGGPWHVVSKDPDENVVYVSRRYREASSARSSFGFESASWISGSWPAGLQDVNASIELFVKTRHGPTITRGTVSRTGDDCGLVDLSVPDKALAPGQFAVFYALVDDVCLGTGVIASDRRIQAQAHAVSGMVSPVTLQAHFNNPTQVRSRP